MSGKVEICGFSGHNIHPGHGRVHIREDKHMMTFESRKSFRMWQRKRNPRKITWTEHYRHDHKKSVLDTQEKTARVIRKKVVRSYQGVVEGRQAITVAKTRAGKKPTPKAKKN